MIIDMIYLPPMRRFLLPALALATLIILYRALPLSRSLPVFILHQPPLQPQGIHVPIKTLQKPIPISNASNNHLSPPIEYFYNYEEAKLSNQSSSSLWQPILDSNLAPLFQCSKKVNKYTGHIRLPNVIRNISYIPTGPQLKPERRAFWNPTIFALPYWSRNQYLVVSRVLTDGTHQESVLCEANVCYVGSSKNTRPGEVLCTQDDLKYVGPAGGMRCVAPPITIDIPPTPAEKCEGKFRAYADIPGSHDPRIFWSGKGEPLMMVNTQSRYACFGLWMIDLRSIYAPLQTLLTSSPTNPSLGPLKSYSTLTEITRNPPSTRSHMEKNWMLFFPANGESYVHYELPSANHSIRRGRTFAKLLGNGLTTPNLTDPLEQPCLQTLVDSELKEKSSSIFAHADESSTNIKRDAPTLTQSKQGSWHQATNSLRLILCNRTDSKCKAKPQNTVFFAIIHRKFPNPLTLPLRYERFVMIWSATPPFGMLGISSHPLLLANETAGGFEPEENWADGMGTGMDRHWKRDSDVMIARTNETVAASTSFASSSSSFLPSITSGSTPSFEKQEKPLNREENWADFTYTVSIAYAWGRTPREKGKVGDEVWDMHVGYLDDEVILGIGIDDLGDGFARIKAEELVSCAMACPGRTTERNAEPKGDEDPARV